MKPICQITTETVMVAPVAARSSCGRPGIFSFSYFFLLATTLELYAETAVVASVVAGPRELRHVVSAFMLMRGADDLSPEE